MRNFYSLDSEAVEEQGCAIVAGMLVSIAWFRLRLKLKFMQDSELAAGANPLCASDWVCFHLQVAVLFSTSLHL